MKMRWFGKEHEMLELAGIESFNINDAIKQARRSGMNTENGSAFATRSRLIWLLVKN